MALRRPSGWPVARRAGWVEVVAAAVAADDPGEGGHVAQQDVDDADGLLLVGLPDPLEPWPQAVPRLELGVVMGAPAGPFQAWANSSRVAGPVCCSPSRPSVFTSAAAAAASSFASSSSLPVRR